MNGRKRPAAPRSRENSPPSQRRRQSEHSSMIDRHANTAHSGVPPSPPYSRKTSAAGLAASMQKRPTPHSTNKRRIDQNRQNNNRDVFQAAERSQISGGQASSRESSMPASNRSGSNTPLHVTSIVPPTLLVAHESVASQSAPMNTLSALRLHKASLAVSVAQIIEAPANQEVKVLKAQLKATQMQEAQLRSDLKRFESQLKQFEALPAQLAALKELVEQQQQATVNIVTDELHDVDSRVRTLENAKPAIDTALFVDLQLDVQAMKTEAKKLDHVPEQLKQLEATVKQHGKGIAESNSRSDTLHSKVDVLTSINEDVQTIKQQQSRGQAMKGDAIRKVAQAAVQPEVVKWEAFRAKYENIVDEMKAHERIPNHTDKPSEDLPDFKDLLESVCGLSEQKEKLAKDINEIRTTIGELQHKSQTDSAQEVHTRLYDNLQSQQETYETEQDKLSEEQTRLRKDLEDYKFRVTAFDRSIEQVNVLTDELHDVDFRVTALETQTHSARNEHTNTAPSSSKIGDLEQRVHCVENHIGGADGLSMRCDKIQNNVEEVEKDIDDCQARVDLIQESFVGIFSKVFDPFKESVEGKLKEHAHSFTHLQGKMEELQRECAAATSSAPQLALIHDMFQNANGDKADFSGLQESVRIEAEQRSAAVEELKQHLAMKQDVSTATQAIDVVKAAVRSLQHQYENISTDDLHQKMVHWFMQNYASPSANMYQQFAAMQLEVTQLRKFTDMITRIPGGAQTLGQLAQLGPQLTALVKAPPASNEESSGDLAKINESVKSTSDSVAQVHKHYDGLAKLVGNLQTSMHSLNSENTPFARAERLATVETSIATLKARSDDEVRARKEFETKASREHDQRVHTETSIKTSVQDNFKKFDALRCELNDTLREFNDPRFKDFFAWLPVLFSHVGQLQWVLEELNQSLPKGGLEIEWTSNWKDEFSVPSPFSRRK